MVNCFCEFEKGTYGERLNEAIKVYSAYPDAEFWDWMFLNCNFKAHSLNFLLTADGKRYIQEKHKLMKSKEGKKGFTKVRLGDKVGKDKKFLQKNSNVLDFIRNGEKKED